MDPIRNILAIVDPTATLHPAVTKAALLAARFEARLELFICDTRAAREQRLADYYRSQSSGPFHCDLKALLETLAEPLRKDGVDVATEVQSADPLHAALIEKTQRTGADLVVKDTHHHSLGQRTFLTHTDWQLIRYCPSAVLLVKPQPWARTPALLAAVDPWHANDKPMLLDHRILDFARAFVRGLTGELHVLHCYMPAAIMAAAVAGVSQTFVDVSPAELAIERQAKLTTLSGLAAEFGVGPRQVHLQIGSPAECLPRTAADLHIDIAALGAISRNGLKRMFLGSTAEEVLERLPCDVLVIKPLDFLAAWPG